jgi:hypothetical protein
MCVTVGDLHPSQGREVTDLRRLPRFSLASLLLLGGCTLSGSATTATPAGPGATQPVAQQPSPPGAWRSIAPPPIPPAGGMAAAWTGHRLVVWGGQDPSGHEPASAGAVYDPMTDRWEELPPPPIAGRFGATAVWTGREVLFWGGQGATDTTFADGAAYDPAARRWRALPAPPIGARTGHQAVWTGNEMVVWGGFERCCPIDSVIHEPVAAAYDPVADRWRRIADVPAPWSGDDGTAVTMASGSRALIWRRGHLAIYETSEPALGWHEVNGIAPTPVPDPSPAPSTTADPFALAVVGGSDVFTWTGTVGALQGLAWRASDGTWRRTAVLEAQGGGSLAAAGSGRVFAAAGQSARVLEYRIADDAWRELPLPPVTTRSAAVLAWTGSELLFWGGIGDEGPEMDGAAWRPGD